jgi:hypothetical protein
MQRMKEARAGDLVSLAAILLLFVALRLPLFTMPGVELGWNSDSAIYGLMARSMFDGAGVPFFFWGQDYLGTLTSMWAWIAAKLLFIDVGPLALRAGAAMQVGAALCFFWAGLRRVYGRPAADLAIFWAAAGPSFLFRFTYAPLSAEQMLFIGSILFWFCARAPFRRLSQWLVFGLLTGIGLWAHRGVLFVVVPALIAIALYDREWRSFRRASWAAIVFGAGVGVGYIPALIGRAQIDQRLYLPLTPLWSLESTRERIVDTLTYDLWQFLGADTLPMAWVLAPLLVVLVIVGLRGFAASRGEMLATGVVVTCFAFWLVSTDAHRGAVRYLAPALPVVYAIAARGVVRLYAWQRALAIAAAAVVAASLVVPRAIEAREVAAGQREQYEHWPGGFDPRPAIRQIEREGYRVCYADFWIAYKLEWLSDRRVAFIPYRSVNRTQTRSLRLAALPGKKCFVTSEGAVRELTPVEAARFEADTRELVRGRPGMHPARR